MKESDVLKSVLEYLAVRKVYCIRMNSGAMFGEHKGKRWAVRFGEKGMADLLALLVVQDCGQWHFMPLWLEVKNERGMQSEDQKAFEARMTELGHRYAVVRSIEDVMDLGV